MWHIWWWGFLLLFNLKRRRWLEKLLSRPVVAVLPWHLIKKLKLFKNVRLGWHFFAAHELFLPLAPVCCTTAASVWMACASQSQPQCLESDLRTTWFFVVMPQTKTGVWRDIKGTWLPLGSLQPGLWFHVSPVQVTVLLGVFYTVFMFSFLGLLWGFGINTFNTFILTM